MPGHDRLVSNPAELYAWRDHVTSIEGGPEAIDGVSASTVRFVLDQLSRFQRSTAGVPGFSTGFWASEATLARKTRTSKRQVRRVLAAFDGELFERNRPKKGARYMYHLILPESADTSAPPGDDCGHQRRGVGRSRPQSADTSAPLDVPPRDESARARELRPSGARSPALDGEAPPVGERIRGAQLRELVELGHDPAAVASLTAIEAAEILEELRTFEMNGGGDG